MLCGVLKVGTQPVRVPVGYAEASVFGLRLLQVTGGTDRVYYGTDATATPTTGVRVSKGDPETAQLTTVPGDHFLRGGKVWLVSASENQFVEWSAH